MPCEEQLNKLIMLHCLLGKIPEGAYPLRLHWLGEMNTTDEEAESNHSGVQAMVN